MDGERSFPPDMGRQMRPLRHAEVQGDELLLRFAGLLYPGTPATTTNNSRGSPGPSGAPCVPFGQGPITKRGHGFGNLRSRRLAGSSSASSLPLLEAEMAHSGAISMEGEGTSFMGSYPVSSFHKRGGCRTMEGTKMQKIDCNWAEMPMDILANIFSFLPVEERLLSLPLVCHGWQVAARLSSCFVDVDVDEWSQSFAMYTTLDYYEGPQKLPNLVQDKMVECVAAMAGPSLLSLRARQCTAASLARIGNLCPSLERLELPDLRGPFDEELRIAVSKFPRLQNLTVQPLFLQEEPGNAILSNATLQIVAQSCSMLKELDLTECRGLKSEAVLSILHSCKGLRALNLDSCINGMETTSILKGLSDHGRALTRLNLADCGVGPDALRFLGALTNLQDLILRCNNFPGAFKNVVPHLKQLVQLDLGDNPSLDDADVEALARSCPLLRILDLSYCAITDKSMCSLGRHCRGLQELRADYTMVTDQGLVAIAVSCSGLTMLSLKNSGLTDAALELVATRLPKLSRLTVAGHRTHAPSNGLSQAGLAALLASSPNLCGLGLSLVDIGRVSGHCSSDVQNGGLDACLSTLPRVQQAAMDGDAMLVDNERPKFLEMSHEVIVQGVGVNPPGTELGSHVEDSATGEVAQGNALEARYAGGMLATLQTCGPNLVDVRLDGPEQEVFEDLNEALIEFARNCPNLRMLDLNYLRNLTDETVAAIVGLCPRLEQVGFGWCDMLTNRAMVEVASSCSRLRILEICSCPQITGDIFGQMAAVRPGTQVLSGHNVVFRVLRDTEGRIQ